ncbi:hypothetical protein KIN20_025437 [Parelaphostrongylus tenuis]|uniref:Uncharacterized protein n=1 Tax=Parelaphostrongylus tenuis TaxID=148309 RepID=A0AAD5QWM7_PARTN|nr:hypothetical protein KIN20_025437 [Parelaphostrongylus tenuis]
MEGVVATRNDVIELLTLLKTYVEIENRESVCSVHSWFPPGKFSERLTKSDKYVERCFAVDTIEI